MALAKMSKVITVQGQDMTLGDAVDKGLVTLSYHPNASMAMDRYRANTPHGTFYSIGEVAYKHKMGEKKFKNPMTALRTEPKSKGHLFWTRSPEYGVYEYYKAGDSIYRAQVYYAGGTHAGSYMDTQTGYRSGGRFETQATPQHLAKLKESLKGIIVRNPDMRQRNPEIDSTDLVEIMSTAFQNGVEVGQQLASSTDELGEFDEVNVEENPMLRKKRMFASETDARRFLDAHLSDNAVKYVGMKGNKTVYVVEYNEHGSYGKKKKRNSIFLAPGVMQSLGQSGVGQLLTRANPTGNEFLNGQALGIRDAREKKSNWGVALRSTYGNNADPKGVADFRAGYARGQKIGKAKRNPESTSAEVYEEFHGKPSEQVTEYVYEEHEHENLAQLGELVSLTVTTVTGYEVQIGAPPADGVVTDVIQLCCSEDRRQLYFVGGNQSIDIAALGFKPEDEKDLMLIGVLTMIEYQTEKKFHKFKLTDYYHALGEETGVQPVLLYDPISQLMKIAGGQYTVKPEGIVN